MEQCKKLHLLLLSSVAWHGLTPSLPYNSLLLHSTLVAQNGVGGLVAQKLNGDWVNVPPISGGIAVNVGEMLQRWSNDILRATPHQILDEDPLNKDAQKSDRVPERYSIAFFCNANKNTSLECLPVCHSAERPPRYEPMNAFEYITMRLTSTIPVMPPAAKA